ncbi:MAG: DUF1592 domain-containing protein [Saprospiraceae bacterium]
MKHSSIALDSISYEADIRPLLAKKCISCHNTNMPKAGVNIDNYKEQARVIADGQFWLKVLEEIKSRAMPPKSEKPLTDEEYHILVSRIDTLLQKSLAQKNPGHVVIRRLSHSEYHHTIMDLLQVDFDARNAFPSDGSGGGGFDNQGRALFFTPLKLERYYDAADKIIHELESDPKRWSLIVPFTYNPSTWQRISAWIVSLFKKDSKSFYSPEQAADQVIFPLATKAFRRFLKEDDKVPLRKLFNQVYTDNSGLSNPQRFNESISQVLKAVLVSPNFLYKIEEEPDKEGAYPLSDFELATRLSYFLWSTMPDQELFELAYKGQLHDSAVLAAQVRRMLIDPKVKRFAENFSGQWLGITKLLENQPMVDAEKFPGFDMAIRKQLYQEAVEYFYYVMTKSNFLDLIQSNYSFLNKDLAAYYGIEGVSGDDFKKVNLTDTHRGGVLGMASVLSTTSLALRTSPVLRGKWVMEQILGISPPPPPEVVAELTSDKKQHDALGLRKILEMHRSKPECYGCHQKMDPLGLGLENYDPAGKWRETYEKVAIDASGVTAEGKKFNGPAELKNILLEEKQKFARNLSAKMLSYAIGRSMRFTDEPALQKLDETLLLNNFKPEPFLIELVKSYPFTMKINDFEKKSI